MIEKRIEEYNKNFYRGRIFSTPEDTFTLINPELRISGQSQNTIARTARNTRSIQQSESGLLNHPCK
jgi:hypothetical protein